MKKIILLVFLLFILFVYADQLEDVEVLRTITDSADTTIDGTSGSNNEHLLVGGWNTTNQNNLFNYSNIQAQSGTLGIKGGSAGGGRVDYLLGDCFNLTIEIYSSNNTAGSRATIALYHDTVSIARLGIDNNTASQAGEKNYTFATVGSFNITNNTRSDSGWTKMHFIVRGTNGTNITGYINDSLIFNDSRPIDKCINTIRLDTDTNVAGGPNFWDDLTINITGGPVDLPDLTPPTNSTWNVTSNNTIGNTSVWNVGDTINVSSNLLTGTFVTNENANCSTSRSDENYTTMVANNSEYKLSTTEVTSHSFTLLPNLTVDTTQCIYASCINSDATENNVSMSGCLNVNYNETGLTLFLNLLNDSRKYELNSIARLQAVSQGEVCIDIDAPGLGINVSCNEGSTIFDFNITTLRRANTTVGATENLRNTTLITVVMDNRTEMEAVQFNMTANGTVRNLNVSYGNETIYFRGNFSDFHVIQNDFIHNSIYKFTVNLTYAKAGSQIIFTNTTGSTQNLTFDVSGFDVDAGNELDHNEKFNNTFTHNWTFTDNVTAPGVFDDFDNNNTLWSMNKIAGSSPGFGDLSYKSGNLHLVASAHHSNVGPQSFEFLESSAIANFHNTSIIQLLYHWQQDAGSCSVSGKARFSNINIQVYDGTSTVLLKNYFKDHKNTAGFTSERAGHNLTLIRNDSTSWEVFINGTTEGVKDLSSLDFTQRLRFRFFLDATHTCGDGGGTGLPSNATLILEEIKWGGAMLNRSTNGRYDPEGNITGTMINIPDNIIRATLDASWHEPPDTDATFYMSSVCNITNRTFEKVDPGILHIFDTVGSNICWKAFLNSTVNTSSPIVRSVSINIVNASASNISIDYNSDGIIDWNFPDVLDGSNSPKKVNISEPDIIGLVPIKITVGDAGQVQINNFVNNASVNPVVLNKSRFETCTQCEINYTFDGDTFNVSDIQFDFLGSLNYTATAHDASTSAIHKILVKFSPYNISLPILQVYDVLARTNNSKNITPVRQTNSTPIFNISNLGYDEPLDIYVKSNETIDSCLNVTFSNTTAKVDGFVYNETYERILSNITINPDKDNSRSIWQFIDLSGCSDRFLLPYFYFTSICSECYFDAAHLEFFGPPINLYSHSFHSFIPRNNS